MFNKYKELVFCIGLIFSTCQGESHPARDYASECTLWQNVVDSLRTSKYSTNETLCSRTADCSGFYCHGLTDRQAAAGLQGDAFSFGLEVDECTYPLMMSIHLQYGGTMRFNQTINIQNSGAVNYSLPIFGYDKSTIRLLTLKWASTLRPIRFQVDLEVSYTLLKASGGMGRSMQVLENIVLVPKKSVPIPNCPIQLDKASTTVPPVRDLTPTGPLVIDASLTDNTVTPLVIAGTVGLLFVVMLVVVVLHRYRLASRLSSRAGGRGFRHTKLMNEDYITDDHVMQI